jgi:hypothetical protein
VSAYGRCDNRNTGGNASGGTVDMPPIVLTWRQAIFICSVHLKRHKEEKDLELTMKLNFLCNDGRTSNHKLFKGA